MKTFWSLSSLIFLVRKEDSNFEGERPRQHLKDFRGNLQADGYAGFQGLYDREREPLIEAACIAHARRKFFDLHAATASPIALKALERIGALYQIETEIRGRLPDERRTERQARAARRCVLLFDWHSEALWTRSGSLPA